MRISDIYIIFAPKIVIVMVVTFNEEYLEKLYTKGETGVKKLRFQPQIVRGYQKGIKYLIQAKRKEDLFPFKSLSFRSLAWRQGGTFLNQGKRSVSNRIYTGGN